MVAVKLDHQETISKLAITAQLFCQIFRSRTPPAAARHVNEVIIKHPAGPSLFTTQVPVDHVDPCGTALFNPVVRVTTWIGEE